MDEVIVTIYKSYFIRRKNLCFLPWAWNFIFLTQLKNKLLAWKRSKAGFEVCFFFKYPI